MHLLAQWRIQNYVRDLDEGAGFNFNSGQARLHSEIEVGENLWLFTRLARPPRYYLVARLVVRAKTLNPPGYKYGKYRVWGDLRKSRYFKVRPEQPQEEAFELLRRVPLETGTLQDCDRITLAQSCQAVREVTDRGNKILEQFAATLADEERARLVVNEYDLERLLMSDDAGVEEFLRQAHSGASPARIGNLLAGARRDRQLARELHGLYEGRCQLCGYDSLLVYGASAAEAHHVVYLSRGGDDALENMMLLCPNHHAVVHKTDALFDYGSLRMLFPNGRAEPLCLNKHLQPRQ
jgi:predicted HNH restriction endonuclease